MTKIKIVGILIFILSVVTALLFAYITDKNIVNNNFLETINEKKEFTQEVSKNIFYIYKNRDKQTKELDDLVNNFLDHMSNRDEILIEVDSALIKQQSDKIILLWNEFYLHVHHFRDKSRVTSLYSTIILEEVIKDIYNTNLDLVVELNRLIEMYQTYFDDNMNIYKNIQYMLFFILILSLTYLFTQVKSVMQFIYKFLDTSKKIIKDSSIKELKPIELNCSSEDIKLAMSNFNFLVERIDKSIQYSTDSIENSVQSLEFVEKNIEDLIDLISIMEESDKIDKELTKKEDAVINSLEELSNASLNLKSLKIDLDNLISHYNIKKS